MDCLCDVASVIVCACVCWVGGGGQGLQQTDLVIKGLEIASHHGGSGYKRSRNAITSRGE